MSSATCQRTFAQPVKVLGMLVASIAMCSEMLLPWYGDWRQNAGGSLAIVAAEAALWGQQTAWRRRQKA